MLFQSWCEALLVVLQHSQPKLINSLWVSNFNTDRFIRGMRPMEIVVIFRLQWLKCYFSLIYLCSVVPRGDSLNILMLYAPVFIFTSFRAPTLWFIDLTVTNCHIQYTFLSLCHFFYEKTDKTRKYSPVHHFRTCTMYDTKMAAGGYIGRNSPKSAEIS